MEIKHYGWQNVQSKDLYLKNLLIERKEKLNNSLNEKFPDEFVKWFSKENIYLNIEFEDKHYGWQNVNRQEIFETNISEVLKIYREIEKEYYFDFLDENIRISKEQSKGDFFVAVFFLTIAVLNSFLYVIFN